jgi:hypothetical protein
VVDGREVAFRVSLATFWTAATALTVVVALRTRDDFHATVDPLGGVILIAVSATAAVAAVVAIRSRPILWVTFVLAGGYSAIGSGDVMSSESSTAPIGVFSLALVIFAVVFVAIGIDVWRRRQDEGGPARPNSIETRWTADALRWTVAGALVGFGFVGFLTGLVLIPIGLFAATRLGSRRAKASGCLLVGIATGPIVLLFDDLPDAAPAFWSGVGLLIAGLGIATLQLHTELTRSVRSSSRPRL